MYARVDTVRRVVELEQPTGKFDYVNNDHEVVGLPDRLIVGRALAD